MNGRTSNILFCEDDRNKEQGIFHNALENSFSCSKIVKHSNRTQSESGSGREVDRTCVVVVRTHAPLDRRALKAIDHLRLQRRRVQQDVVKQRLTD